MFFIDDIIHSMAYIYHMSLSADTLDSEAATYIFEKFFICNSMTVQYIMENRIREICIFTNKQNSRKFCVSASRKRVKKPVNETRDTFLRERQLMIRKIIGRN